MTAEASISYSVKENNKRVRYVVDDNLEDKITIEELLKFTKNALLTISEQVLKEEQDRGFDKDPITTVDGITGKSVQDVNPLGKIVFTARQEIKKIALDTYANILKRAPIDTGLYASLNYVFFNGTQIATNMRELEKWFETPPAFKDRDRLRFMNIAPYAQMLELEGVTRQRKKQRLGATRDKLQRSGAKVRKPNGTYALTMKAIRAKYKNNVFMRFELLPGDYVGVTSPIPPNSKQKFRADYHPSSKYNKGYYLYPTIVLGVVETRLLQ